MYVSVNLVAVPSVWIRDTAHLRVLKCLSARPHRTYPFVFENEDFFSLWFGLSPPVSGENGQRKRIFSNRSPEPRFSNTPFAGLVWMKEKRIRQSVGSSLPRARDETKCACSNQRRYRFQPLLHFRLDVKKRFKNATWGEKRRKESPLSDKDGYVWTGTKWVKKLNVQTFRQYTHLSSSSRWINLLSKLSRCNRWS